MTAGPKRAVFAGCARNCATHLPAVLRNIERMSALFGDVGVVIVENDSTDATRQVLETWGTGRRNFHLVKLDGLASAVAQRTVRLELARNLYADFVRTSDTLSAFDYLIVLDCDEVNVREADLRAVARALEFLEREETNAAVFANNTGLYHDVWALRHDRLCPGDAWEEVMDYALKHHVPDDIAFKETFEKRLIAFDPAAGAIEVESAFDGLGIYKMGFVRRNVNPYLGYKVRAMTRDGRIGIVRLQTCEHVHFNRGIRALGGRLFILPYLVTFNAVAGKIPVPVSAWRSMLF